MTAEELETLKQAQRQAIKGGNLAECNRINKILVEERERRQKAKGRAREQELEKVLSAKISTLCEKMLSALSTTITIYFKEIKKWDILELK